jgi:branched-chain amino acid transport system permease protein
VASFSLAGMFVVLLNGLVAASMLFIVAAGVSIIFGVSRVANFAHGSFYMIGAYVAYSIYSALPTTLWAFVLSVVGAGVAIGALGMLVEILVLRRIYHAPELLQLVATFALVLIAQDAVQKVWGPEDLIGPRVPHLKGAIDIFGRSFPEYNLLLIVIAPLLLGALWLLFNYTRWGTLMRAASQDREMVEALGIDQKWLFTSVFILGSILAGLAGGLQVPREGANLGMDLNTIIEAFVVVVIGGMGSLMGCFFASVIVGIFLSFGALFLPKAAIVLVFVIMAVTLAVRPNGLLGKPGFAVRTAGTTAEWVLKPFSRKQCYIAAGVALALVFLPLVLSEFGVVVATEILIFALFGCSLYFLIGPSGMPSFGHAAYFAIGAYAAALMDRFVGTGIFLNLLCAPAAAVAAALIFGWFCVRLSGVYLAMLTLAFAQIVWSIIYSWNDVTGGENGLVGIHLTPWLSSSVEFYYLALVVTAAGVVALQWIIFSPFGYGLRAGRDAPIRSAAIGIDVRMQQWLGLAVSAAFAGLAGGLMAYLKRGVYPEVASVTMSIDAILVTLVGGMQSIVGPVLGAAIYHGLKTWIQLSTDAWRAVIGVVILLLVMLLPKGVAGLFEACAPAIAMYRRHRSS